MNLNTANQQVTFPICLDPDTGLTNHAAQVHSAARWPQETPKNATATHLEYSRQQMADITARAREERLYREARPFLKQLKVHSPFSFTHSMNVASFSLAFGIQLNLHDETLCQLTLGALLHDIGKTRIPGELLDKPGKLDGKEMSRMRGHVTETRRILEKLPGITAIALESASFHHERLDGSGYPEGKSGNDYPMHAQIVSIADAYDAMTAGRPYRHHIPPVDAIQQLTIAADRLFHGEMLRTFAKALGMAPDAPNTALAVG